MSIKKIQTLLDKAPSVSQWWLSNKTSLKRWDLGFDTLAVILLIMNLTGIGLTVLALIGLGLGWWEGEGTGKITLLAYPCGAAASLIMLRNMPKVWPKKFTFDQFQLSRPENEDVSADYKYKVLSRLLNVSDLPSSAVQQLHNIKQLDLPKCWWDALENTVVECIPQEPSQQIVKKSAQEKLDEVYVKLDQATHEPSLKVLRL